MISNTDSGRHSTYRYVSVFKALIISGLILLGNYSYANDFEVGVNVHLRHYPKSTEHYLTLVKKYGFTSFRGGFLWGIVERKPGEYKVFGKLNKEDEAYKIGVDKYGLNSMMILAYGNPIYNSPGYPTTPEAINSFVNYAYWTASRFKGKVKYYEIWNEWTVGTGIHIKEPVPPPKIYAELVKKTAAAVKRADPNAIVMAGSVNPLGKRGVDWFDSLIKLGILDHIDGVSIHPYSYRNDNISLRNPEDNLAGIDRFQERLKGYAKKQVPIYITEIGVPTHNGAGGMSNNDAAQYIVKYTMLAKSRPYIKGIWWYDLIDDGDNPKINEHRFGFLNRQEKPKPAALAFQKISKIAQSYTVSDYTTSPDGVVSIALKGSGNEHGMLYWQKTPVPVTRQSNAFETLMSNITNETTTQKTVTPLVEMKSKNPELQGGTPVLILSDKPVKAPVH